MDKWKVESGVVGECICEVVCGMCMVEGLVGDFFFFFIECEGGGKMGNENGVGFVGEEKGVFGGEKFVELMEGGEDGIVE